MELTLRTAISFIVGGAYVSSIVWISERLGPRIGAVLAGTPTTILVGLGFIAAIEGSEATQQAIVVIPVLVGVALIYGFVFVSVASVLNGRYRHIVATLIAIAVWAGCAMAARDVFSDVAFGWSVAAMLFLLSVFHVRFRFYMTKSAVAPPRSTKSSIVKFVAAGSVVAGAILAANVLGPTWGGVATSFPALVASSLYFLNQSQGCEFAKGWLKHLPAGYISLLGFLIVLHQTITRWPVFLSFVAAMLAAVSYSFALLTLKKSR